MITSDVLTIRQHFPSVQTPTSSYWVYEQIKAIQKMGKSFVVIAPQPYIPSIIRRKTKYPTSLKKKGVYNDILVFRPIHFRIPNYKLYGVTNYFLRKAIVKVIADISFKLIHAHFGNDGVAALPLRKKYNVPLITSFYGYDLSDQLEVLKSYYKDLAIHGDLFLALSQDMKNDLLKAGFHEDKIVVHHLGVNFMEIDKYYKIKQIEEVKTFLIVARFSERKGIHDAIKAFSKALTVFPNILLKVVGNGEYKESLFRLVSELNINKNVIFIDNFQSDNPRRIVLEEMALCDVFVLTSYTTSDGSKEGTPIVLMEAQAMAKPCISTYHAGIPEIIIHEKTGILVEERDINGIENAIIKLIKNKALARKMGEEGRLHMKLDFDNKKQNKILNQIYSNMCKNI